MKKGTFIVIFLLIFSLGITPGVSALNLSEISLDFSSPVFISGGNGTVMVTGDFTSNGDDKWSYRPEFVPYLNCIVKLNDKFEVQSSFMRSIHQPEGTYYSDQDEKFNVTGGELEILQFVTDLKYFCYETGKSNYYLSGGIGVYYWYNEVQYETSPGGKRITESLAPKTDLGLNLGSGVEYKITEQFKLTGEGKYHWLHTGDYQGGNFTVMTFLSYRL